MKILLIRNHPKGNINTRLPEKLNRVQGIYPPLGLAYIAAVLEKGGHKAKILDAEALNLDTEESKKEIFRQKADIVGITCMSSTLPGALEAARFAKESGAKVILGGPQLAVYPKETLSYDYIDYGCIGEGEYTFLELANALEQNSGIEKIDGLVYKKDKNIIANKPRIVEDINQLPFPARHLLPMNKYDCIITKKPVTTMITTRGCPFRCGFCFKQPSDKVIRFRNAKNIVDEMEDCIKKYNVKEIMFYDDIMTLKKQRMLDICNEITKRKLDIQWEAPTRADCVDEELLREMKKAGCIRLRYGVESGDARILDLMNKRATIPLIKKAFRMTHQLGIETFAYFIMGYLHETPQTMQSTINLAKELNPDWVMFTIATPYPCTDLYSLAIKEGIVNGDYWKSFTLGKTTGRLPFLVDNAEKWVSKAYKEFYFRPSFIIKKFKKLNSFDTFKKYLRGALAIGR